jgi:cobalt-precorrin 5A hydrolase
VTATFITLSREGAGLFPRLAAGLGELSFFVHNSAGPVPGARPFDKIQSLTAEIFPHYRALIYAAPCGVVVRALAGCLQHKTTDPAVVVLDVAARWCVSLLSGHEGGANDLAMRVGNVLGAEPVITTTTEAVKNVIVGIGCRSGVPSQEIATAIRSALSQAGVDLSEVRLLASADVKANEPGLHEAAVQLGLPLRFIASEEIRLSGRKFTTSEFVERSVGLPAVAEPAALLAGRRTRLFLPKTVFEKVTVALARECSTWSESGPETRSTEPAVPKTLLDEAM